MKRKWLAAGIMLLCIELTVLPVTEARLSAEEMMSKDGCASTYTEDLGTLSGYVTDPAMNPIEGALVRVYFHDTYKENYSDSTGYYHVTDIPICYCIKNATCSKDGYQTQWALLSIYENTSYDFVLLPLDGYSYPVLTGTLGDNGWYVSSVGVIFVGPSQKIDYRIDGSSWITYTAWFALTTEGIHVLEWTCDSNMSVYSLTIKIDKSTPYFSDYKARWIGLFKWRISVNAFDDVSGVNGVLFFLTNTTDTKPPYQVIYRGCYWYNLLLWFGKIFFAIEVWDNAGNYLSLPSQV